MGRTGAKMSDEEDYMRYAAPAYGAPCPPQIESEPAKLILMSNSGGKASEIFKLRKLFRGWGLDLPLEAAKYFSKAECPVVLLEESERLGIHLYDLIDLRDKAKSMSLDVEVLIL